MAELSPVRARDCACPGTPHEEEGDVIYVALTLSLEGGLQAETDRASAMAEAIAAGGPMPAGGFSAAAQEVMAVAMAEGLRRKWLVTYVRYGAADWNLVDEHGPLPFSVDAILANYNLARPVADKCDELYGETVALPLLSRQARRSPRGPKAVSTSPMKRPTARQSKRSSPRPSAATKRSVA